VSTHDSDAIDAAMQRAREALAHKLGIGFVPIDQLRVLTDAILEGVPTERDVQELVDEKVQEALANERKIHEVIIDRLQAERGNDLVGADDELKAAVADAYERGKRRMRVKHERLSLVVDDLKATRELVEKCLAWSGPAGWKQDILDRLDGAIERYTP
jgi:hypothetical protein